MQPTRGSTLSPGYVNEKKVDHLTIILEVSMGLLNDFSSRMTDCFERIISFTPSHMSYSRNIVQ